MTFDEFKRLPIVKIIGMMQINCEVKNNLDKLFIKNDFEQRKDLSGN